MLIMRLHHHRQIGLPLSSRKGQVSRQQDRLHTPQVADGRLVRCQSNGANAVHHASVLPAPLGRFGGPQRVCLTDFVSTYYPDKDKNELEATLNRLLQQMARSGVICPQFTPHAYHSKALGAPASRSTLEKDKRGAISSAIYYATPEGKQRRAMYNAKHNPKNNAINNARRKAASAFFRMIVLLANPALSHLPLLNPDQCKVLALSLYNRPGLVEEFPTQSLQQLLEQRRIIVYWGITSQAPKFEVFRFLTKRGRTPDSKKTMPVMYNRPVLEVAEGQDGIEAGHIKESVAVGKLGFKYACVFQSRLRHNAAGLEDAAQDHIQKLPLGLRLHRHVAKGAKIAALEGLLTTTFITYAIVDGPQAFTFSTDNPRQIATIMVKGIKLRVVQ